MIKKHRDFLLLRLRRNEYTDATEVGAGLGPRTEGTAIPETATTRAK
jgi:hypothetical protein